MRFDHVGVLVADLEAAKRFAAEVLGLGEPAREFEAPDHGLKGAFFDLGGRGQLELFTIDEPGETRLRPGEDATVDHVAVRVDDLDEQRERLGARGVRFSGPTTPTEVGEPVELRGVRHLWTKPETSGGFMLQLIESRE